MNRLSIAVVQGGPSNEAEVSRASAAQVAEALATAGHSVVRHELDAYLAESLRGGGYDVVFPVTHGALGEDGALQGLCEILAVPYVGSDVLASALAMSKLHARRLFSADGLPIARGLDAPRPVGLERALWTERAVEAAERARAFVGPRLVVKPSGCGSALGVERFEASAAVSEVARAIEHVWEMDGTALIEQFARGLEVTCGVFHPTGEAPRAFPATLIESPNDPFYTYEARYAPGRSVHTCPAPLPAEVTHEIGEIAVRAHEVLGCRDLSRVDFIVGDDGAPDRLFLLEVNTLPGFTKTSLYPEAASVAGISFPSLCEALARSAHKRGVPVRNSPRPLPV